MVVKTKKKGCANQYEKFEVKKKMPGKWEKVTIILILKSGDATDRRNDRGMSLLDVVYN